MVDTNKIGPYIKLHALLAQAQANDQLHERAAADHSQKHSQELEAKRVARAAVARTGPNSHSSG